MNEMKLFENPEFGNVRTLETDDGKVMFCGVDIANALGYSNSRDAIQKHCKVDGVAKCDTVDSKGRKNTLTFISEGNVYRLITHSKLPDAERFEKWVFDEVLPSIRKTGSYNIKDSYQIEDPIERAKRWIEEQQEKQQLALTVSIQEQQINEMQPKVSYYDIILQCNDLVTTSQIAKDYGKSAQWLNNKLYNMGIQYPQNNTWLLYKKYQGEGYTQSRTGYKTDEFGDRHSYMHTCWTQKGRTFLYYMLKRDNVLPLIEQPERRRVLL